MQNFTQIVGAKVICAYNAEFVGTVLNIQTDKSNTRAKNLIIAGADDESMYLLPLTRVLSIGEVVVIRNRSSLSVVADGMTSSLINTEAVTLKGVDAGRITEIEFDDKFFISNIQCEKMAFSSQQLINSNNGLTLFNDTDKKYKNSSFAPRARPIQSNSEVMVEALEQVSAPLSSVATPRTIIARLPKTFREPK